MSKHSAMAFLAALIVASAASFGSSASLDDFVDFSLPGDSRTRLPGRLYIPPEAVDASTPRPFILFLHGAGESGTDNVAQVNGNIDNLLAEAKQRGAFLYAPQTALGWANLSRTTLTMSMIDRALAEFPVDGDRLYVTGLSMGGGGTWNMLNRHSDRFAAAVPIAGVSPSGFDALNVVDKPIWAFHSRDDGVVSALATRNVVEAILSANGRPAPDYPSFTGPDRRDLFELWQDDISLRYTELGVGGHGIWSRVYRTEAMHDWLFSQALAVPVPEPGTLLQLATCCLALAPGWFRRAARFKRPTMSTRRHEPGNLAAQREEPRCQIRSGR